MAEQNPSPEVSIQPKPEFDGDKFIIDYLSTSPNGFEISTDKKGRRRERNSPLPLNSQQRKELKEAMVGQMKFASGDKAQEALYNLRNSSNQNEEEARIQYEERRRNYVSRAGPKVGIRNVRKEGNLIVVDVKPADFPTYSLFGNSKSSPELLNLAVVSATSSILETKDNRFVVQLRSPRNQIYGGTPGASIAGYFDGQFFRPSDKEDKSQERGTLNPINTDFVKNNMLREAEQELGLNNEDITSISIVGLAHEKLQVHDEFLGIVKSNLTAKELETKSRHATKNIKLKDKEFYEKYVDISATPDAIETLLTKVMCPLPLTHVAAFVAAGYFLKLNNGGLDVATQWKKEMEIKVRKNNTEIDAIVKKYYEENPQELTNIPQGKPPRNPNAYDPFYLPQEQGLPDAISELKRVGLIS